MQDGGFLAEVGTWLSLVEHSLGVRGVGSSNLPVPTIISFADTQPVHMRFRVLIRARGQSQLLYPTGALLARATLLLPGRMAICECHFYVKRAAAVTAFYVQLLGYLDAVRQLVGDVYF